MGKRGLCCRRVSVTRRYCIKTDTPMWQTKCMWYTVCACVYVRASVCARCLLEISNAQIDCISFTSRALNPATHLFRTVIEIEQN